jgi:Uma2 family endonuclease
MAVEAIHVPVEEYLRLTEKPYREYRDGVVTVKPMATFLHAMLQSALIRALFEAGAIPLSELTVRISASKYLVPDVAVGVAGTAVYPSEPVTLCCEILSPEDRLGATLYKCEEYHAWGVPFCWVLDPVKRTAWEYFAGGEPERVSETIRAGAIAIDLRLLFESLPRE